MKYIAFSLFGSLAKYCVGACKNLHLAKHWYPDYKPIFWIGPDVPKPVFLYLHDHGAIVEPAIEGENGLFWRFYVNDELDCERYLIRDVDSRIGEREVLAVREWEKSGKPFHVIRDHPHHATAINGGLWGATRDAIGPIMGSLLKKWDGPRDTYDADQEFLRKVIWPRVKDKALQHDSCCRHIYKDAVPLPSPLTYDNPRFCGEVFDHLDRPRSYDWELMLGAVRPENNLGQGGVEGHARKPQRGDAAATTRGEDVSDESNKRQQVSNPASDTKHLFIRPHLGLGDALIVNGLVRTLSTRYSRIVFPAKRQNMATVKEMFTDLENVEVVEVEDDDDCDGKVMNRPNGMSELLLGMYGKDWNDGKPGWDKLMYEQAGVPFEHRWEVFKIRPLIEPERQIPWPYAVVHHDSRFPIPLNRLPHLPYLAVNPIRDGTLFGWVSALMHAEEIHCIDSSVAILADSIPTVAKKLVLHLYARKGAKPPTYRKEWQILTK